MPSAFSLFYNIQVVTSLGDAFGTAFPSILFVVSFLSLTNLLNRIFVACKMEAYQFGDEIVTEEQLKEGKRQLERHRKATARTVQRDILKDSITDVVNAGRSKVEGFLWGEGRKKKTQVVDVDPEAAVLQEPASMTGTVERKGGKNSFGLETGWKEEYVTIKSPGVLCFFKEFGKAQSGLPGDFTVELRLALSFNELSLGAKGYSLEIELPDSTVRLRFKSKEELANWKAVLILWKDYSIDYAGTVCILRRHALTLCPYREFQGTSRGKRRRGDDFPFPVHDPPSGQDWGRSQRWQQGPLRPRLARDWSLHE